MQASRTTAHVAAPATAAPQPLPDLQPLVSGLDSLVLKNWRFQPGTSDTPEFRSASDLLNRVRGGETVSIYCPESEHPWSVRGLAELQEFVFAETNRLGQLPPATRAQLEMLSKLRNQGWRFYSAPNNRFAVRPRIVPVWLLRRNSLYAARGNEPRQQIVDPNLPPVPRAVERPVAASSRAPLTHGPSPSNAFNRPAVPEAGPAKTWAPPPPPPPPPTRRASSGASPNVQRGYVPPAQYAATRPKPAPRPASYSRPAMTTVRPAKARRSWRGALFGLAATCAVIAPLAYVGLHHAAPAPVVVVSPAPPPAPPVPTPAPAPHVTPPAPPPAPPPVVTPPAPPPAPPPVVTPPAPPPSPPAIDDPVVNVAPVVVRQGDRQKFAHELTAWAQGDEGNCSSVAVIKAAVESYGTDVFDEMKTDAAGALHVRLWDGVRVDVTADELHAAHNSSGFYVLQDKDSERFAETIFAVEAKHLATQNGWTMQQALNKLDNGFDPKVAARLLGLEGFVHNLDVSDIPNTHLAVAYSTPPNPYSGHAVIVEDGKTDHGGEPYTYDKSDDANAAPCSDGTSGCSWYIGKAFTLGNTADASVFPTYIGVQTQQATADELAKSGQNQGALLSEVTTGSPAQQAGLKRGDVILKVDGHPVDGDTLRDWIKKHRVGDSIQLKVWSNAKAVTIDLKAAELPLSTFTGG